MAKLVAVSTSDLAHVVAEFNAAMLASTVEGGMSWTLAPVDPAAMPAVVTNATLQDNGQFVDLVIGAALSAGKSYVLTAPGATTAGGAPLAPGDKTITFAAPAVVGQRIGWPMRNLEAITRAIGEQVQVLAGRAVTRLVADFGEDDAVAFVESTLGHGDSGGFVVGQRRYTYTSKTDCSFAGCQKVREYDGTSLPVGTELYFDLYAYPED